MKSFAVVLSVLALGYSVLSSAAPRSVVRTQSDISFSVTQMGVAVQGKFTQFDAVIDLDTAKPQNTRAEVTVDIASLTTGNSEADAVALDKPWLDKLGFPKAVFRSTSVKPTGADSYEVGGTLTIRGKSRELTVPIRTANQPDGSTRVTGQLKIRRTDFGIGGGEWNEDDIVANEVPVTFRLLLAPAK